MPLAAADLAAAAVMLLAWMGTGWWVERGPRAAQAAGNLMAARRCDWMREMARREVRIMDGGLLRGLQAGSSFFASAALIGTGGVLTMMGQSGKLAEIAAVIPYAGAGAEAERLRLLAPLGFTVFAFFKFAWAQRLFGYCGVLIGATPAWDEADPSKALVAADTAAEVNALAARSFNRGLRGLYFTLGSLAWLAGPGPLLVATALVAWTIHRREYRSESRAALLKGAR